MLKRWVAGCARNLAQLGKIRDRHRIMHPVAACCAEKAAGNIGRTSRARQAWELEIAIVATVDMATVATESRLCRLSAEQRRGVEQRHSGLHHDLVTRLEREAGRWLRDNCVNFVAWLGPAQ